MPPGVEIIQLSEPDEEPRARKTYTARRFQAGRGARFRAVAEAAPRTRGIEAPRDSAG